MNESLVCKLYMYLPWLATSTRATVLQGATKCQEFLSGVANANNVLSLKILSEGHHLCRRPRTVLSERKLPPQPPSHPKAECPFFSYSPKTVYVLKCTFPIHVRILGNRSLNLPKNA